ncbi:MAG: hypothetical protein JSW27_18955 [Phycisphaerales bacterium]|nr:MAG: hypothetical protein JSW27_18955 [Phycisphaerales bacterium]
MYCRTQYLCMLIVLTSLLLGPSLTPAATLEVGPDGRGSYPTIQAAVDAAAEGDIVVLLPGTYVGTGNRDIDLRRRAVTIQSTDPEDVDTVETTVIDCQGTIREPHRGFYAADFSGAIRGLTITNGVASDGGAIYCQNSALALAYCRVLDNATLSGEGKGKSNGGSGGGVYCLDSSVEIVDCLISGNATGAGMDSRDATAGAGGDGGGIYATNTALHISDSTIADNSTGPGGRGPVGGQGGSGAGVYAEEATIERCIVEGNTCGAGGDSTDTGRGTGGAGGDGGGVFCQNSADLANSLLVGNRCGAGGDGVTVGDGGQGGGIWCASGLIDHCTVAGNAAVRRIPSFILTQATDLGAGIFCSTDTHVTNAILWDNAPDQIVGQDCSLVTYCNIEGGVCSEGRSNTAVDPLFVQPGTWVNANDSQVAAESGDADAVWASGDYRLSGGSPCIDAGDPEHGGGTDETDLEAQARLVGAATDMGAYEAQGLAAVYRFVSPRTGKYFYTPSEAKRDDLIDNSSGIWTLEGIAYYVHLNATHADLVPVYRFWSPKSDSYFWTISEAERDRLINEFSDVWTYEGLAFYAYPESSRPEGTKPVYRFWSVSLGAHFYTIDENEKQRFINTMRGVWEYESIAWYAFDEPPADGPEDPGETPETPTGAGVYELFGGTDAVSYVLELKAYLDGQEARIDNARVEFLSASSRMQMDVDFDASTAQLTELHTESEFLAHSVLISEIGGSIELPVHLYLYGFFDASVARGPYAIDPRALSFPTTPDSSAGDEGDVFTIAGAATVEREKFDANAQFNPTAFQTDGTATFLNPDASGRLDVDMAGAFQWRRSQDETLLLDAPIRGHLVQLYVTSAELRTTGQWVGKRAQGDEK